MVGVGSIKLDIEREGEGTLVKEVGGLGFIGTSLACRLVGFLVSASS